MNSIQIDAAKRSVLLVHELIHTIFTSEAAVARAAIGRLMPMFSDSFSMVTTAGHVVGRSEVEQMFNQAAGARPGLEISVSEMQAVWSSGDGIAVRYQETHRLNGVASTRCSVAILEGAGPSLRWSYLHETALSPA